jgi:large subunit ribosomal protein L35
MKIKQKTKKAAAKRFKITATGKIKAKPGGTRHNLGNKSRKRKRGLRSTTVIFRGDEGHIKACLPYGGTKRF